MEIVTDNLKADVASVFTAHPTANQVYTTADAQMFLTLDQAGSHASNMLDKKILKHSLNGDFAEITEDDYTEPDLSNVEFDSENPLNGTSGAVIQNANKDADEAALLKSLKAEYIELFGESPNSFFKAKGLIKAIADKRAELATGNEAQSPQPEADTQTTNPE